MSEPYAYDVKVTAVTDWDLVYSLALATAGMTPKSTPNVQWKSKIMKAMHSPIRALQFKVEITIPYWVSVHLVRHNVGVQHYVQSQRVDRTGEERDSKPQDAPVRHTMLINAEALVNISRRRLCYLASPETRRAWTVVIKALKEVDPVVGAYCVPQCIAFGHCIEMKGCGRYPKWLAYREKYERGFINQNAQPKEDQ